MELKSVIDQLRKCEHCLCANERDCYEFLCAVSESTDRDRKIIDSLSADNKKLKDTVALLSENNAYLREKIQKWIPVEEALPRDEENVWATDGAYAGEAYWGKRSGWVWVNYRGHAYYRAGVCTDRSITHWMRRPSLPEPPKEDTNE